jgi:hypothetical protein
MLNNTDRENILAALVGDEPMLGMGHNLPPTEADVARERVEGLVSAANRWARERPEITDAETAARANDFLEQLAAEAKKLELQRRAEKRPHEDAAKAVDARYRPLADMVGACKLVVTALHSAWLRREQDRLAIERRRKEAEAREAQRLADEAARKAAAAASVSDLIAASEAERAAKEASAAAAAVPERAQTRGQLSGRARSLKTTWHARVVDPYAAIRHYRDRAEVRELVERLANADARAGVRAIPGCAVYSTQE